MDNEVKEKFENSVHHAVVELFATIDKRIDVQCGRNENYDTHKSTIKIIYKPKGRRDVFKAFVVITNGQTIITISAFINYEWKDIISRITYNNGLHNKFPELFRNALANSQYWNDTEQLLNDFQKADSVAKEILEQIE